MTTRIDCDTCVVRGFACHDCVVTVLLGPPPELSFDDDERAALLRVGVCMGGRRAEQAEREHSRKHNRESEPPPSHHEPSGGKGANETQSYADPEPGERASAATQAGRLIAGSGVTTESRGAASPDAATESGANTESRTEVPSDRAAIGLMGHPTAAKNAMRMTAGQ